MSDRIKLPNRRQHESGTIYWQPEGPMRPTFEFHVSVAPLDAPPLEIFLKPAERTNAVVLAFYADLVGESVSLMLQHGHSVESLLQRWKPGSLELCAVKHIDSLNALRALAP